MPRTSILHDTSIRKGDFTKALRARGGSPAEIKSAWNQNLTVSEAMNKVRNPITQGFGNEGWAKAVGGSSSRRSTGGRARGGSKTMTWTKFAGKVRSMGGDFTQAGKAWKRGIRDPRQVSIRASGGAKRRTASKSNARRSTGRSTGGNAGEMTWVEFFPAVRARGGTMKEAGAAWSAGEHSIGGAMSEYVANPKYDEYSSESWANGGDWEDDRSSHGGDPDQIRGAGPLVINFDERSAGGSPRERSVGGSRRRSSRKRSSSRRNRSSSRRRSSSRGRSSSRRRKKRTKSKSKSKSKGKRRTKSNSRSKSRRASRSRGDVVRKRDKKGRFVSQTSESGKSTGRRKKRSAEGRARDELGRFLPK